MSPVSSSPARTNEKPIRNQVLMMESIRKQQRKKKIKSNLDVLKQMLLNCDPELITVHKDGPRSGKYHTVDILEMTVDHLTRVRKRIKSYQNNKIDTDYAGHVGGDDYMGEFDEENIWRPW
ncbi:hypothetical protein GWI33_001724 [Rhynchophorus ferrugineus]|uniref:BHLH domain-containing protein n=1 Tax=Rhynchophorus ferrugineus TaxID=354439 RepID=A0A834ML98_RHYFE|nr:hypothetical protein GWI33_001724 [Rhynchophorus ferrugineus]